MTDEFDYEPDEQPDEQNDRRQTPKQLREAFDRVSDENATLKRDLAFTKAGLPDTPQVKLLRDHYKGEFTAEAIRKQAVEYGLIDAEDSGVPKDELDALDRVAALGNGSGAGKPAIDMNAQLRRAAGRS